MQLRPRLLVLACSLAGLVACTGKVAEEAAPAPAPEAAAPAPRCERFEVVPCLADDAARAGEVAPGSEGALLWMRGGLGDGAVLAVRPDGIVERTAVPRTLAESLEPSPAIVRARLSPRALDEVRVAGARLNARVARSLDAPAPRPESAVVFATPAGRSCLHERLEGPGTCASGEISSAFELSTRVLSAVEAAWRAGTYGTVALRGAIAVKGDWPLGEGRAEDGLQPVTEDERAKLAPGDVFRMPNGDFTEVEAVVSGSVTKIYVTRHTSVRLEDDLADVREALLADADRWTSSKGTWLGVSVGPDRFARFKNRGMAVLPDGRVFRQRATERLDLTAEAPIELPPK